MPDSTQPRWTECQLSLPPHSAYYYNYTNTAQRGEGGLEPLAAAAGALGLCKVLCWLPLIATRNTPFYCPLLDRVTLTTAASPPHRDRPTDGDRPSTLMSHCQHSDLLRYHGLLCSLGGAFDRDHCRSAVDHVTIIRHFV